MKRRRAQRWLLGSMAVLACAACRGKGKPEPARSADQAASAPRADAPQQAPVAQAATANPIVGSWCMQAQALGRADGERIPDGSRWEFRADGSYDYAHKGRRQQGRWTMKDGTLSVTDVGDHKVVELTAERMVLKRTSYQFFGRDCGPEYAKAELVMELVAAADEGALARVERALARGADVNAIDRLGLVAQTALMAAARRGRVEVVDHLLLSGARHDVVSPADETALSLAELNGHNPVVASLVRAGAVRKAPAPSAEEKAAVGQPAETVRPSEPRSGSAPQESPRSDATGEREPQARAARPSSANDELTNRFLEAKKREGREDSAERLKAIEERIPEQEGMTEAEREDLSRRRMEAFLEEE